MSVFTIADLDWFKYRIYELSDGQKPAVKAGPFGSALKKEEYVPHGYKVYGQEQVIRNDASYGDYYISEKKYKQLISCSVNKGDILISLVGTVGKVLIVPDPFEQGIINPRLIRLSLDKKIVFPPFMKLLLETEQTSRLLKRWSQGGTMGVLNAGMFQRLPVILPLLPEQKAIADLLSTWDEAIEKTERLIRAKETSLKGQIQNLISHRCDSWPHIKPKKIFDTITEKNFPDAELLSVTQDRGVIPRSMLEGRVMSPDGTTASYKRIKKGDFAISLRSFQGGIEYSNYQGIISPAYTVLRPKIELNTDFYRLFFKSYIFIEKYLNLAVIGIRDGKQISIPDFMTIRIAVPTLNEQQGIAETLSIIQNEINLLKKLANKYKTQKRGLMQKMLTGEWRVKYEIVNQYTEGEL